MVLPLAAPETMPGSSPAWDGSTSMMLPLGGASGVQASEGTPPLPPELLPPGPLPPGPLPPTPPEALAPAAPPGPVPPGPAAPSLPPAPAPPELESCGDPHPHTSKQTPTNPIKRTAMRRAYPSDGDDRSGCAGGGLA